LRIWRVVAHAVRQFRCPPGHFCVRWVNSAAEEVTVKKLFSIPVAVSAAAIAVLAVSAAPVSAAPAGADTGTAVSQLTMTKSGSVNRQVTLECNPDGGTHPTPVDACAKITAVGGHLELLTSAPGVLCTADWNPVTVTVTGFWQFQWVSFSKTYSNDCVASVGSNYVFRF
jgi:cytochrome c1